MGDAVGLGKDEILRKKAVLRDLMQDRAVGVPQGADEGTVALGGMDGIEFLPGVQIHDPAGDGSVGVHRDVRAEIPVHQFPGDAVSLLSGLKAVGDQPGKVRAVPLKLFLFQSHVSHLLRQADGLYSRMDRSTSSSVMVPKRAGIS